MLNPAEKTSFLKESLMSSGHTVWCIDDRESLDDLGGNIVTSGEKGPQLLGASLAPLPALVETALEAGIEPDVDDLIEIVFEAHKSLGMETTVHMDNHHGEMTNEEVIELIKLILANDPEAKIPGCGFKELLANKNNPLGLSAKGSAWFQKNNDLVERFVRRGARLIVLGGDHADKQAGQAFAVRNNKRKTTLDTVKATKSKAPAYNHDDWFYGDLIGRCAEILEAKNQPVWLEKFRQNAVKLNNNWLDKTTEILAGMKAVAI